MAALCRLVLLICALVASVCGSTAEALRNETDASTVAQPSPANASAASSGAPRASSLGALSREVAELRALLDHANDAAAAASEAASAELLRARHDLHDIKAAMDKARELSVRVSALAAAPSHRAAPHAAQGNVREATQSEEKERVVKDPLPLRLALRALVASIFFSVGIPCVGMHVLSAHRERREEKKRRLPRERVHPELAPLALPLATPSDYLPLALVLNVVARLPAGARLRLAEVSRAMRAAVSEPSLWADVDLSAASGPVSDALLDAVLATSSELRALDVSGQVGFAPSRFVAAGDADPPPRPAPLSADVLCIKLRERGGSLRALRATSDCERASSSPPALFFSLPLKDRARFANVEAVVALLAAVPRCERLDVDVAEKAGNTRLKSLLRRAPPFAAVAVRRLAVGPPRGAESDALPAFPAGLWPATSLLHDIAAGPPLQQLELHRARYADAFAWAAATGAFVESSVVGGLSSLSLTQCTLGPTLAPLLAQLLAGGRLRRLRVADCALLPSTELCSALRASSLTHLAMRRTGLFRDAGDVADTVGALARHPTLKRIDVSLNACPSAHRVLGAALGQLVAANTPPLVELAVSGCNLDGESSHPIVAALPGNHFLRVLECDEWSSTRAQGGA